jgi:hypothetical protein
VRQHRRIPDHTSPSKKGDDMAVSKSTRRRPPDTRRPIQAIFRKSSVSEERKRAWYRATAHLDEGPPVLRFPLYEHLYSFNLYAQKLVDAMGEISVRLSTSPEDSLYHQFLVQQLRASVTSDVLDHMSGIEHTEEWLFESLRRVEEKKLRDPDDVYLVVREREMARRREGQPPRVRFVDEETIAKKTPKAKSGGIAVRRSASIPVKAKENADG